MKHVLRKRRTSRTKLVNPLQSEGQINSTHSSTSKTPQETDATNNTTPANIKNVRLLAPPMLFHYKLRRQCQPLTFRALPAPNDRQ